MSTAEESNFPIQILIDDLKNEETQIRLNSIRKLTQIAKALGPERTRNELIPFLKESVDDEDEVLIALAEELEKFVEYIGGSQYIYVLLSVLSCLASVEEASVRDKTVETLTSLSKNFPDEHFQEHFFPLVESLAQGEWFASRTSACGLFSLVYPKVDASSKAQLRNLFSILCSDETPMVRRSAVQHFGNFVKQIELEFLKTEILQAFLLISEDDQDSVRLLSVLGCCSLAKRFSCEGDCLSLILPTIRRCTADRSWRVRYMVAENFCQLCDSVGPVTSKEDLFPAFIKLLRDNEPEVRTVAAKRVAAVCSLLAQESGNQAEVVDKILPCVKELVYDSSQQVRAALASNIMGLAPLFGKEVTIANLDLFLQLLKDDFPEVRLNVISKLDAVNKVIGIDLLSQSLLPAIVQLAEDRQWRVRLAIIEYIPLLANQLGVDFFDEKLGCLCMTWLGDSVYSIREAATQNLTKLTEIFGVEWAQATILPKVLSLYAHPNYLYRLTTLFAISSLGSVMNQESINSTMLPLALRLASDSVPNIRFNVAKTLQSLCTRLDSAVIESRVKPCLLQLNQDNDPDVKFFAAQALQSLNFS